MFSLLSGGQLVNLEDDVDEKDLEFRDKARLEKKQSAQEKAEKKKEEAEARKAEKRLEREAEREVRKQAKKKAQEEKRAEKIAEKERKAEEKAAARAEAKEKRKTGKGKMKEMVPPATTADGEEPLDTPMETEPKGAGDVVMTEIGSKMKEMDPPATDGEEPSHMPIDVEHKGPSDVLMTEVDNVTDGTCMCSMSFFIKIYLEHVIHS
jgi:hypothetical protein